MKYPYSTYNTYTQYLGTNGNTANLREIRMRGVCAHGEHVYTPKNHIYPTKDTLEHHF